MNHENNTADQYYISIFYTVCVCVCVCVYLSSGVWVGSHEQSDSLHQPERAQLSLSRPAHHHRVWIQLCDWKPHTRYTHKHTDTNTQTHTNTDARTQTHTDTDTHTQTHKQTHTHTHRLFSVLAVWISRCCQFDPDFSRVLVDSWGERRVSDEFSTERFLVCFGCR